MGTALLHRMLNTIEAHDQSPLIAQRALWRISRGMRDDDVKDTTHNLFDWFCEFNKSSLSEEDQALLDTDPNTIEDEDERKRLIRRQTKASKRAKSAKRTFTSKATPELVAVVEEMLASDDHVGAADKLFFATACAPIMSPSELVFLLKSISATKAACSPSGGLSNVQRYVEQVRDLGVFESQQQAAQALWWLSHAPLSQSREYQVQDMINAACGRRVGADYKAEFPEFVKKVGKTPRKLDFDIFKPDERVWERIAVRCPVELKPVASYKPALTAITDAYQFIEKRLNRGQVFDSIVDMMAERDAIMRRGDFELPDRAYIDETIGDCLVQTIVSSEELRANGTYMGNCTYSNYHQAYKKGDGVLFRIVLNGDTYNTDIRPNANGWRVRETAGRHNGHNIPQEIKDVNALLCQRLAR